MGSLDAMKANNGPSDKETNSSSAASRYYSDSDKILVAQGVVGTKRD